MIIFPKGLAPRIIDLHLSPRSKSSGESLNGYEQIGDPISQKWRVTLTFNTLKREFILPYRAFLAKTRGRSGVIKLPVFDKQLWPKGMDIGIAKVIPRESFWSGLTDAGEVVDVAAVVSGDLGDKEVEVDLGAISEPWRVFFPGHYFGVGDNLHIATDISWVGSVATITFEPSLREDAVDAAFRLRPYLICSLAEDESGRHPLELGLRTAPQLDLVELTPEERPA